MVRAPSQKFLVGCLAFLAGIFIASRFQFSTFLLAWLTVLWLIILLSGQADPIEVAVVILFAGFLGLLVWQLTGGEVWLKLQFLDRLAERLVNFRDNIVDRIFLALPEPHGSLLSGILLGNRVKLDRDLIATFRAVGLSHIIAVSGYNLTIITANVETVFAPLLGRLALGLSAILIILFVIITGAAGSILRAAAMAGALLLAKYLGRPSRSVNILIFAAALIAIFEPKIIFDIGFQLSILATYGLVRLGPLFGRLTKKIPLPKTINSAIGETLAATLMTLPLIIAYFERLSTVSPIANVVVVPLIPLLMGLGGLGVFVSFIFAPLGHLVLLLTWPILQWIIFVGQYLADLSFATADIHLSGWLAAGILLAMVIGVELLNRRSPSQ